MILRISVATFRGMDVVDCGCVFKMAVGAEWQCVYFVWVFGVGDCRFFV